MGGIAEPLRGLTSPDSVQGLRRPCLLLSSTHQLVMVVHLEPYLLKEHYCFQSLLRDRNLRRCFKTMGGVTST